MNENSDFSLRIINWTTLITSVYLLVLGLSFTFIPFLNFMGLLSLSFSFFAILILPLALPIKQISTIFGSNFNNYIFLQGISYLFFGIILLIVSINLFKRQKWARYFLLIFFLLSIIFLIYHIINLSILVSNYGFNEIVYSGKEVIKPDGSVSFQTRYSPSQWDYLAEGIWPLILNIFFIILILSKKFKYSFQTDLDNTK